MAFPTQAELAEEVKRCAEALNLAIVAAAETGLSVKLEVGEPNHEVLPGPTEVIRSVQVLKAL